ncbi:MAG: restriction endonuclease subunit S, partial [Candidatus Hadarchaeales archaeon]
VGVSILVDRDFDNVIFGSYLIKVKLKPSIHPKFVHYFFQSSLYWKHLQKAQGSTLKNVNLPLLKSLKIPLPPLPEQRKIAEIFSIVDKKLELERKRKEKLERIKRGLMNDLLTGKKRVKI